MPKTEHVQLFISEDFKSRIYTVRLGHSTIDLNGGAEGYGFVYFLVLLGHKINILM
jgi:hypothetical protein